MEKSRKKLSSFIALLSVIVIGCFLLSCSKQSNLQTEKSNSSIVTEPTPPATKAVSSSATLTKAELYAEIDEYLSRRNFSGLEAMAAELRKSDIHLAGGYSALYQFYARLKRFRPGGEKELEPNGFSFMEKRQLLEAWLAAIPTSITAKIALSQLYLTAAWDARGEDFFQDLSPGQIAGMDINNKLSRSYLDGLDPKSDPQIYLLLMNTTNILLSLDTLTAGSDNKKEALDILFERAIKEFPTYFHYYASRANTLQTKWLGATGELALFAQQVYKKTSQDKKTLPAYAFIASELLSSARRDLLFSEIGLRWPQMRASYESIEMAYGLDNRTWNILLSLAVQSGDLGVAKTAIIHIDEHWDKAVYIEQGYFDTDVAWVNSALAARNK